MIKIPLIVLLLFCAFYGSRQRSVSPVIGLLTPVACAIGIVFVVQPQWSTDVAKLFGVGRGADLVLYIWTAISVLLLANTHFRLRSYQAMLTVLTREVAILEARQARNDR
jgi:small membrane protein